MKPPLFDHRLRALRRDRAARMNGDRFLLQRAFDDCRDRLRLLDRRFQRVLIAGCTDPGWPVLLADFANEIVVMDPGPMFAAASDGTVGDWEAFPFDPGSFDLVLTIGLLDTANDLARAGATLRCALRPGGLAIGAIAGGHSLPSLRRAMIAADSAQGQAMPRVHPRIEAPALAQLLHSSGLSDAVVDIDRVQLSYPSLDALIADLRAMAATNILSARPRKPLGRQAFERAAATFLDDLERGREWLEILHFAAWAPADSG